ncbi:PWWP domain-containing protein 2A-like [Hibiscus syriacus]|uniref:PWWP domain-containing protein 2A-like n=1 Tax=Hibiscus syriacus TaxID=106335 RepID=UPI00192387F6|nr:PWWP domain-containing protein 2A-like [Hibiscus syriacus]
MAVGSSGGVTKDLNVNASPQSGDGKPLSSADQNSLPCDDQKMSSKEGSSDGLESFDVEIGTPDDTKKNQTTVIQGERDLQNAENLNQSTSSSEDGSSDVNVKSEFCVSDLVSGKVQSHPWWPGQIFDSSAATVKAKKYLKKESYLIAYYGDQTFA